MPWSVLPSLPLLLLFASCTKVLLEAPLKQVDPPLLEMTKKSQQGPIEQWNIEELQLKSLWGETPSNSAVKIALVGTGVDYNHPELRSQILIRKSDDDPKKFSVGKDFVDGDDKAYDHYGFDTQLAGILAAAHDGQGVEGLLPQVSLIPIRYIDEDGMAQLPDLIDALEYAVEVRPDVVLLNIIPLQFADDKRIAELELKGLFKQLERLKEQEIPVVIGAGQGRMQLTPSVMGRGRVNSHFFGRSNIVVVTSYNQEHKKNEVANGGETFVHTAAPGEEIWTTAVGGGYTTVTSTNAAAAHVAAALAFAQARYAQKLTAAQLVGNFLQENAGRELPALAGQTLGPALDIQRYLQSLEAQVASRKGE